MKINIQIFGGGGGPSGGSFRTSAHKMPNTGKPNSSMTRYDSSGEKRETRYYDKNGDRLKDVHYKGPPNHEYPHEHYWWKDEKGNWHRTDYDYWAKGGRGK